MRVYCNMRVVAISRAICHAVSNGWLLVHFNYTHAEFRMPFTNKGKYENFKLELMRMPLDA